MKQRGKHWLSGPSLALCVTLCGCASQGPLRPPSLNLPASVKHLDAKRVGNTVELSWTNPAKTTDGVTLSARRRGAGPLTAELCRSENSLPSACTPFTRIPVTAGETSSFHDALPHAMAAGPDRGLYYSVRVVNATGRGAKSTEVASAAGTAPEPLHGIQAYPVANGIFLHWQPAPDEVKFRVSRGTDTAHTTLLRLSPTSMTTTGEPSRHPSEWSGTLDTGGRAGQQQRYSGYRERTVQVGGQSVVLQSDPAIVVVAADAKLPLPAPATALEAVVNTLGKPQVDLVWQPPDDASVTGYRVYRQDGDAPPVLLTAEPLHGFTFADQSVETGHRYTYRVSAVNPTGESPAASATASLP